MINILLITISVFVLIFFEHFLIQIFGFSIYIFVSIFLWERIKNVTYLIYFPLVSIILDITMGFPLGVHMTTLLISLLLLTLFRKFIPGTSKLSITLVYSFIYLVSYILSYIFKSVLLYSTFPDISITFVLVCLGKALISGVLTFVLIHLGSGLRDESFEKIRLR